jgi:hypothetical protein
MLSGYLDSRELGDGIDNYLVAPGLGARAGVLGAIELAREAPARGRHQRLLGLVCHMVVFND